MPLRAPQSRYGASFGCGLGVGGLTAFRAILGACWRCQMGQAARASQPRKAHCVGYDQGAECIAWPSRTAMSLRVAQSRYAASFRRGQGMGGLTACRTP
jgi:hypothetical protein